MPAGLWRGVVERVATDGVYVSLAGLPSDALYGPIEPIPDLSLTVGDRVLCGFLQAGSSQVELVRLISHQPVDTYTDRYQERY